MNIEIQDKQHLIKLKKKFFRKISELILKEEKKNLNFELSFLLVDNQEIQKLNLTYRNIDKATDVLAFPMLEECDIFPSVDNLLGDIVISIEKAIFQAEEYGHSIEKEIAMLVIHGLLHLLKYDHIEYSDEEKMKEKERYYLEKVIKILNL